MSPTGNSLDLNNLPEEYGKQVVEESSTTTAASTDATKAAGSKKKRSGGKDDIAKVYECRFCSLKFCKSQALGGHMNRHRQERETETLNRARQLVFSNEGLAGAGVHMGLRDLNFGGPQPISPGGFQQRASSSISDPCLQFRPVYPRLPAHPPHLQPYVYPSSSAQHSNTYPPSYSPSYPPLGEYFIGHVLSESSPRQPHHSNIGSTSSNNITCFGAPLANAFQVEGGRPTIIRDGTSGNQTPEPRNWNCSYGHG